MHKATLPLHPFHNYLLHFKYDPFALDAVNDEDIAILQEFVSNIDPDDPPTNDFSEFAGDGVYNKVIRKTITNFVDQYAPHFDECSTHSAIEFMYQWLIKNDTMGRIFARTGVDLKIVRLSKKQAEDLAAHLGNIARPPPKFVADIMEAYNWAFLRSAGWTALEQHYRTQFHFIMRELLTMFNDLTILLPDFQHTVAQEANQRWFDFHREDIDPIYNRLYHAQLARIPISNLSGWLHPIANAFQNNIPQFSSKRVLRCPHIQWAFSGYEHLTYMLRTMMDMRWPEHRVSLHGGAAHGTNMILCDESIAIFVRRSGIFASWEKNESPKILAQLFSAAVDRLCEADPKAGARMISDVFGRLLRPAYDVAASCGPCPTMPSPPYRLVAPRVRSKTIALPSPSLPMPTSASHPAPRISMLDPGGTDIPSPSGGTICIWPDMMGDSASVPPASMIGRAVEAARITHSSFAAPQVPGPWCEEPDEEVIFAASQQSTITSSRMDDPLIPINDRSRTMRVNQRSPSFGSATAQAGPSTFIENLARAGGSSSGSNAVLQTSSRRGDPVSRRDDPALVGQSLSSTGYRSHPRGDPAIQPKRRSLLDRLSSPPANEMSSQGSSPSQLDSRMTSPGTLSSNFRTMASSESVTPEPPPISMSIDSSSASSRASQSDSLRQSDSHSRSTTASTSPSYGASPMGSRALTTGVSRSGAPPTGPRAMMAGNGVSYRRSSTQTSNYRRSLNFPYESRDRHRQRTRSGSTVYENYARGGGRRRDDWY
ncbi:hypothetical protein ONZ45_g11709 [Pleurotus djamor]|nr:hypothetical protein ONZ45_g11709 [Pleurotus djamor]